jgi:hypothetical protein
MTETHGTRMRRAVMSLVAVTAAGLVLAAPAQATGRDTDHDGMPDRWERAHGLDWQHANARGDADHDGVNNLREFHLGSDPRHADSNKLCDALNSVLGDDATECTSMGLTEVLH